MGEILDLLTFAGGRLCLSMLRVYLRGTVFTMLVCWASFSTEGELECSLFCFLPQPFLFYVEVVEPFFTFYQYLTTNWVASFVLPGDKGLCSFVGATSSITTVGACWIDLGVEIRVLNWFLFRNSTQMSCLYSSSKQINILINPEWCKLVRGFFLFFCTCWLIFWRPFIRKKGNLNGSFSSKCKSNQIWYW